MTRSPPLVIFVLAIPARAMRGQLVSRASQLAAEPTEVLTRPGDWICSFRLL
jgi:hypothetical protein